MSKRCGMIRIRCCAAFLGSLVVMPAPIAHSSDDSVSIVQDTAQDRRHTAQQWLHRLGATPGAWQPVQTLTWFGRTLWLRQFTMAQGLNDAAQQLTQTTATLDRILMGPNALLLSGRVDNLHVVVQLQRADQGVSGVASLLDTSPSMQYAALDPVDSALTWLPQDTRIHAAQWQLPDGSRVWQDIHVMSQTPEQLRARLHAVLARQGWRETSAVTGGRDVQWQRRGDHLHLMADRSGQGSVLYQHLTQ